MAGLWWMAVMLVLFLSVGSSDAVDQIKLAELIQKVKDKYSLDGIFSMALSVKSEDPENLEEQLFADNPEEKVKEELSKGAVYNGKRLAVAKLDKPEDGALRVLQKLKLESEDGDLLIIYSYASPCPGTCTDIKKPDNIIKEINSVISHGHWSKHVFVFEKVFKPKGNFVVKLFRNKNKILKKALENLGTSGIPLANIFRCYKPQNVGSAFQCTSCSSGGVAMTCIDYNI